jgi:4'-phosphopantetheinyl transferase
VFGGERILTRGLFGLKKIDLNWKVTSVPAVLAADEVHVWALVLSRPSSQIQAMWQLLSAAEQARAKRFHFDQDRDFYTVGRGVLRTLIGQYEGGSAADVSFAYGEQGKPQLLDTDLKFNVSHAQGLALMGFCRGREIGVDLEMIRPLSDVNRLAKRSFSAAEYAEWTAVAEPQKMLAFFNCWTRKEAYIKAIGQGLACPLGSFAVSLRPAEPAQLLQVNGSQTEAAKWDLRAVTPAQNFVGAVLVEGSGYNLRQFAWPA